MDLFEALSVHTQLHQTPSEQMPATLESLPAWQQLIVESRQLQTVADLLMEQSKRQITTAKRRIELLHLLQTRLRGSCFWHCNYALSLHFSEEEDKECCFLFSPYEEVMTTFSNGKSL